MARNEPLTQKRATSPEIPAWTGLCRSNGWIMLSSFLLACVLLPIGCGDSGQADPAGVTGEELGPGQPFEETIDGTTVGFEMVYIPKGTIEVDDPDAPGRKKSVEVGDFWMGKTEVTWDLYDIFVYGLDMQGQEMTNEDAFSRPSKPYITPDRGFGHAGYPALSMSHLGSIMFCVWLSNKTGHRYRLPNEYEWQYACLARADAPYSCGEDPACLDAIAWYRKNSNHKTHPVGTKQPNAFGLHDMHGNTSEWANGMTGGRYAVPAVHGGSFQDKADKLTATSRKPDSKSWNASDPQIPRSHWWLADGHFVGMRLVCEDGPRQNR